MKFVTLCLFCLVLASCEDKNNNKLLYYQLETYEKNLEEVNKAIDASAAYKSTKAEYLKKNYDSMSKIATVIKNFPHQIGDKNRIKLIKTRDSINTKFKLYLKFINSNTYENVDDSIFNKTIIVDFLRLTEAFQLRYVLPRKGCFTDDDL
ncbi:hypothetical protein [Flavobacterium sp.]|uniref:hypothetical protein n=1 Tax=Flavobacterium sp. TaxID=239 RepID=UPI0026317236|nr:hypothetical protein [Flavobacterium sp.]